MNREHIYDLTITWTGNTGTGTSGYRSYERSHIISSDHKPDLLASADPVFRGDRTRYNPEELLVASLSSCHMLWFLHLCADHGVVVTSYIDRATGILMETETGGGKFTEVTLCPTVTVTDQLSLDKLEELHEKAHELCFISNSVNFNVNLQATGIVKTNETEQKRTKNS